MSITFNGICNLLEGIELASTRQPRLAPRHLKSTVRQIISNWCRHHRNILDHPDTNGAAVLSAILPHRRKDRVYGLQPRLLSKKITKLLNFNNGQNALFAAWTTGAHGDLGVYTERATKPWDGTFKKKSHIPIDRIDRLLVQLAARYRFSDPAIRKQREWHVSTDTELQYILQRLESWEAKWLVRLILREYTTIEIDEGFLFERYHFLLPELLMFQNDFDAVFAMLNGELSSYPPVPDRALQKSRRIEAAGQLKAVVGVKVGRPQFHKAWSFKHCFQLLGKRAWAAEVKYDGEYCEIHVDLDNAPNDVKIFSKNGKDATADRQALHGTIRDALGIGRPDCIFKRKCIVLGELVLYSDNDKKILPFSKIRKHISRSGSFMGTLQDSLPHEWEHLKIVFFDVLMLDDEPILRKDLQDRRRVLKELVRIIPGRSMRSEWTLIDAKSEDGITDLKQAFARTLANHQEGLVLKPLHAPYFPLLTETGHSKSGFFVKMKKDYLADMGGERDLGDFAIVGASFDPQVAAKSDYKPLHWTHFHLGCLTNKVAVQRTGAKPKFKLVGSLSLDMCIPKLDLKYLNTHGNLYKVTPREDGSTEKLDFERSYGYGIRMSVAFKKPFVAEILGGGYEKTQNESFEMLRHPRIKKLHHDRTWEDTVTMDDLERMAAEKWDVPDADKLEDGHAKDVALLVKKYVKELYGSQTTASEYETTQETTQCTTPRTSQQTPQSLPSDAVVQETQENTYSTVSSTQCSGSTQGVGIRASRELRVLVRQDTSERIASILRPVPSVSGLPTPTSSSESTTSKGKKRTLSDLVVSPPPTKRRKVRSPLKDAGGNRSLGAFDFDSQERTLHVYAEEGVKVQVHTEPVREK
ncbi:hypothetical protein BDV95DRAFT_56734 [Massariosphaeria phaeospora]|uniref:ATP-dependent DNA ligase family profile domain-containing protein n=1 Tax=Massariosphaeria phaeospora TaxID=100035 RepID=A0A7C8M7L6_9PLEO|nr:hypothetical protein BDV95DRAFT_56734 [Massariosphaeria phaeospora]